MNIADLSHDERLALVALTELAVISDRNITANEVDKVDEIVEALGEDVFQKLADEAETRFADRKTLKTFLSGITRQEARDIIYGTVLSESLADTIPHEQAQFLESLATDWKITLELESDSTEK
jgi:hypothetical protein